MIEDGRGDGGDGEKGEGRVGKVLGEGNEGLEVDGVGQGGQSEA